MRHGPPKAEEDQMERADIQSRIRPGSPLNGSEGSLGPPPIPRRGMRKGLRALGGIGALLCALTALHCSDLTTTSAPALAVTPVALSLSPSNSQVAYGT